MDRQASARAQQVNRHGLTDIAQANKSDPVFHQITPNVPIHLIYMGSDRLASAC
jgi:hypothetical protein